MMTILKTCNVEQELERCHLCDGIVAHGDVVRESPGIDDEGVRYVALEHAECVDEDERLGVTENLDAEERGACLADLAEVEDSMGEPVSPEYRAFRAEVDARVPLLTGDARRITMAARDLAATVDRAQAAEAKVKVMEARWATLRAKVDASRQTAQARWWDYPSAKLQDEIDLLAWVLKLMDVGGEGGGT